MAETVAKKVMQKRFYLRHAVPVVVWLATVAVVVWLFYGRLQQFEAVGIARGQVRQVAASCTGRIKEIRVPLFAPVKEGQPLVVVDTVADSELVDEAKLRTELATAAAEAESLGALLIPTEEQLRFDTARLQNSREDNGRRFEVDVESARLRIVELQATIASDGVLLDDLAMQVKINQKLLEDDAIVPYEADRVKGQHDSFLKKIQENERLLELSRVTLQQAEQRRDTFTVQKLPRQSEDAALEAIRKQIGVQEVLVQGLIRQLSVWKARREVELTSPIDGVVIPIHGQRNDTLLQRPGEELWRQAGEVVNAGDAILAVAEEKPTEIVMYVPEQQLGHLEKGMPVELARTRTPPQVVSSTIAHIGPAVELMPQRLWLNPALPQWGLPVLIQIPPGLDLIPGEIVRIRGL